MNNGLCECGCGEVTVVSSRILTSRGYEKGKSRRFKPGHNSQFRSGNLGTNWKGGRRTDSYGYVWITMPEHPRANGRGYVREHIIVMERLLGRPIRETEAIHHISGKRHDNSPGNLMLFATKGMHISYHHRLKAFEVSGNYDWRQCSFCHDYDDPENMAKSGGGYYHRRCQKEYDRFKNTPALLKERYGWTGPEGS